MTAWKHWFDPVDEATWKDPSDPYTPYVKFYDYDAETKRLRRQLVSAVEALRKLAEIHHGTLTPSKLHDPNNRAWTECECRSCRLAQSFRGQ